MLLAASGCGSVKQAENPNLILGKQQFVAKCGACHTLARADTKGTVGPNLDEAFRASLAEGLGRSSIHGVVQYQVEYPNPEGVMPKDLASGNALRDIAAYVAYAADNSGADSGLLASAVAPAGAGKPAVEKAGKLELEADPGGQLAYTAGKATATAGPVTIAMKNTSGRRAQRRDPDRHERPRAGRDSSAGEGHRLHLRQPEARRLHLLLPGPRPPRSGDVRHADGQVTAVDAAHAAFGRCCSTPRSRVLGLLVTRHWAREDSGDRADDQDQRDDDREHHDHVDQQAEHLALGAQRVQHGALPVRRTPAGAHRRGRLEDVDRRVHDDPHDVDEVPVDAGHLDAAVLLGAEVAAEGPDRHDQQQDQADADVAPCRPVSE